MHGREMRGIKIAIACLAIASGTASPVLAGSGQASETAATTLSNLDEIKISLFSHRRTPDLFWQIDSRGKGSVTTPEGIGYLTAAPLIANPVYRFAPGEHRFDIGEAGYAELRAYLGQIIDGKPDPYQMSDNACSVRNVGNTGWVEMAWTGEKAGGFNLSHNCLNGTGQHFSGRMVQAWHVLARNMHARGNSAVTIDKQPEMPVPKTLNFTKRNAWTGASTNWVIGATGKGWIELSQGGSLLSIDIFQTHYAKAGRYHFQLDRRFHQAVLRELDPYLSGSKRNGACEDETSTTDQPMVRITWTDQAGKPAIFNSDLGCPSFARRFLNVELAFAELVGKGRLGASRIVTRK